jgi:hypothetical protein
MVAGCESDVFVQLCTFCIPRFLRTDLGKVTINSPILRIEGSFRDDGEHLFEKSRESAMSRLLRRSGVIPARLRPFLQLPRKEQEILIKTLALARRYQPPCNPAG